eukprot:gene20726-26870_t
MPTYYSKEPVTLHDIEIAKGLFNFVMEDKAPGYLRIKESNLNKQYTSALVFVYETFYARLFEVIPTAKDLFKTGFTSQGQGLVKLIAFLLMDPADIEIFKSKLLEITEKHNERGIRAVEYGIAGDCLFYSLDKALGPEIFTPYNRRVFERIFSRSLTVIIPSAVSYEIKTRSSGQLKRYQEEQSRYSS